MAVTITTALANHFLEELRDKLDAATSAGNAIYEESNDTALATCPLSKPCAGSASSGSITFNSITSEDNASAGTADHLALKDGNGTEWIRLDVAEDSSEEVQISETTFTAGDTVGVSSLVLEMPTTTS